MKCFYSYFPLIIIDLNLLKKNSVNYNLRFRYLVILNIFTTVKISNSSQQLNLVQFNLFKNTGLFYLSIADNFSVLNYDYKGQGIFFIYRLERGRQASAAMK